MTKFCEPCGMVQGRGHQHGPVDDMRRAAWLMREQHGPEHKRREMWVAMSSWLGHQADLAARAERFGEFDERHWQAPLTIARAYLKADDG